MRAAPKSASSFTETDFPFNLAQRTCTNSQLHALKWAQKQQYIDSITCARGSSSGPNAQRRHAGKMCAQGDDDACMGLIIGLQARVHVWGETMRRMRSIP
jgi:hypothetical protein